MTARRVLMMVVLLAVIVAIPALAQAYPSEATPEMIEKLPAMKLWQPDPDDPGSWIPPDPDTDCWICHGTQEADERSGPHGNYLTTTNKCAVCHSVHMAPAGGVLLLPAATVKDTCETCHDGTGGRGVYGAIAARGLTVESQHSVEATNAIPGGDPSTGATATATFSGAGGTLTCTDCHSPHGNNVVEPFTGDRARSSVDTTVTSTRLLKKRPTTGTEDVERYGSDWCGACHKGRLAGSGEFGNHPVDSSVTQTDTAPFHYDNVARVVGALASTTEMGTLGRNNFGYVMPDPRTPEQDQHYPICQQCHEDTRAVGNVELQQIDTTELYSVTATDGVNASDNPRFQVFPHESNTRRLLVEPTTSLCTNCHGPMP